MNKVLLIIPFVLPVILMSCSRHVDDAIIEYIEKNNCTTTSNIEKIDLQTIFGIEYDSLFLFSEYTRNCISDLIGVAYNNPHEIPDSYKRLILMKSGEVVFDQDVSNKELYFEEITEAPDMLHYACLIHYETHYWVRKEGQHYLLQIVKGEHNQYRIVHVAGGSPIYELL